MDLSTWIQAQHGDVCARVRTQVLERVPVDRLDTRPSGDSSSIAWILWHCTRHQDVAVNAVVRGLDEVLQRDGWDARVGADRLARGAGLSESDDVAASSALLVDALLGYVDAVWTDTASWLASVRDADLDRVPDAAGGLARAGVPVDDYPWLYRMWDGKPVSFHVSWETIGHGFNHLGEMTHVRNRLGLGGH